MDEQKEVSKSDFSEGGKYHIASVPGVKGRTGGQYGIQLLSEGSGSTTPCLSLDSSPDTS